MPNVVPTVIVGAAALALDVAVAEIGATMTVGNAVLALDIAVVVLRSTVSLDHHLVVAMESVPPMAEMALPFDGSEMSKNAY